MTTPLADLIVGEMERQGLSLSFLEPDVPKSSLRNVTAGGRIPREDMLRAIAEGLGLPFDVLRQAAEETRYGPSPAALPLPTRKIVAAMAELDPADALVVAEVALAVAAGMRRARESAQKAARLAARRATAPRGR